MYLKSIEVQGFKSFAHKIKFEFHNGITGIVGPNGSGKSNVADAVRWVLGEQRIKQLRGDTMQDVIFSGTENRKPLSYAAVAITLDNGDHKLPVDYEEVTVTRKLYRSGESEYLLNGTACRLKDIHEMFYDTGIGKEGYSIIGQGQIDRIVSGKPEERRELFDEAAGIVKYKRRKNLSVKKLEEEQQNLVRVRDILAELEKQAGPLEKQSEVAKEYLKKKESLKIYDINMFLLETERIREMIGETEEKLQIAQQELEAAREKYEGRKAAYEKIEEEVEEISVSIEQAKRQQSETTILKKELEGKINVLKEQIHSAKTNDEHYDNRTSAIRREIKEREEARKKLLEEQEKNCRLLEEKKAEDEAAKAELLALQEKIQADTEAVEQIKQQVMELLNRRASLSAKMQYFTTAGEQIEKQKAELTESLGKLEGELQENEELLLKSREKLAGFTEQIQTQRKKTEENQEKIGKLQKKLAEQQTSFQQSQNLYHREASRLESLKNITERYDGYGNSIRRVMSQKSRYQGLFGVVADLIKTDKIYELAVETALGGSIQNIVTDTEETAKQMIAYLKQNKYGRATFLPLNAMRRGGGIARPEALREAGVIGTADILVKTEEKYLNLVENLLGRTIVVQNIDFGIAIARKYRQTLRIVTLEGELINPGGAIAGGAYKNSSNLLSRRREIEEAEKQVVSLKEQMESLEKQLESLKGQRAECYAENDRIKQELQRVLVEENTARLKAEQLSGQKKEKEKRREMLEQELAKINGEKNTIAENQEAFSRELEHSQNQEAELHQKNEDLQRQLEAAKEQEQKKRKTSEDVHLAFASLEQQSAYTEENLERLSQERSRFEEELKDLDLHRENASDEIREKQESIRDLEQTIEDSKELFAEIAEEIETQTQRREKLNQKHRSFLKEREEISAQMADLDKECFRLTQRKENYEESSEKQINYMWDEYELTYNHAKELRNEKLTDLSFMKKQIQTLKQEIKQLGNVNVNAIEEFKQVSERYEFLKGQHDDLVKAEAELEKIIEELDTAMRKQFAEEFQKISGEFNRVFKQLFGGGKGTLELTEEADILDAGIRIIAQPPGKKLQNMMQLSGGEKSLTAIALLFAIQNLKPSPFCLLDEIEAALDESNVVRFAQYLHKLTENTQFIVITHRRGTMAAADRLYGITMQEKGVSTQVSVDLLEDELDK